MKVYCSGIGGIGLSAYAALQRAAGHTVLGSDRSDSELLRDLRGQGIEVFLKQDGSTMPEDLDLFVYSEAIPEGAPERATAAKRGVRSLSYFQALGEISKDAFVIAVCGTHGKSSTTAMAARLLVAAGKDPTVVVGTKTPDLDGRNWRKGASDVFLLEACEYRRSFHYLWPDLVLMTNVDGDHFDAYADVPEYQEAFVEFLRRMPESGVVVTHGKDPDCVRVVLKSGRGVVDADKMPLPMVGVPGLHMRENARLVLGMARQLGIPDRAAFESLEGFRGTWRRMEVKGELPNGCIVVDDYAHHPKEIAATLAAMREAYPDRRVVCVFQPHTHDRTLKLYGDFTKAFRDADVVLIPDVYVARKDIESGTVDMPRFVDDIARESDVAARAGGGLDHTEALLRSHYLASGDVVVCMGAGTITGLAARLLV